APEPRLEFVLADRLDTDFCQRRNRGGMIGEPVEIQSAPPPGRWAEPVETAEPLPEAEVVYDAVAEPAEPYPADDLFTAGGAYGDPIDPASHYPAQAAIPRAVLPPAKVATKMKHRKRATSSGTTNVNDWIAYFVLFALLPMSALFLLLGLVQFFRLGRLAPPAPPSGREILRDSFASMPSIDDLHRNKRSRREALSAGLPIVSRGVATERCIDRPRCAGKSGTPYPPTIELRADQKLRAPPDIANLHERAAAATTEVRCLFCRHPLSFDGKGPMWTY
ncbi:MAG: hypothetical protein ACREHD_11770, partial [Pirellulales bacterium]